MLIYFLRRLLYVCPVAIGVSIICFMLVHIAPGDPLTSIMAVDATAQDQAAMRAAYGLDKPLPQQYVSWLGRALSGDLGQSISTGREVSAEIGNAIGNSVLVALMAAALQELLDLRDQLLRVAERTDAASAQLEAAAVAALFLAEHLRNQKDAVAQRFTERAMSLTQTLALIRQCGATRTLQIEQPIRMVGAIQDVALVILPGFLASIAAVAALPASKARITPTEAGELAYQLQHVVEKLKTSTS